MIAKYAKRTGEIAVSPDQQLESGLVFFREAESYLTAARTLSTPYLEMPAAITKVEEWIKVYRPAANIYCHAIELYLKGYLLSRDFDLITLSKKPFGHDLVALMKKGVDEGLVVHNDTEDLVNARNAEFASYLFRYPKVGSTTICPAASFDDACADLRKAVFPSINLKARALGRPVPDPDNGIG